ncbi:hypothetical protein C8R46DRAFT_1109872 [Mycena filopes]|nr:hypothetical protein C8R46DRAFT_1109872 [Mycena filopes]
MPFAFPSTPATRLAGVVVLGGSLLAGGVKTYSWRRRVDQELAEITFRRQTSAQTFAEQCQEIQQSLRETALCSGIHRLTSTVCRLSWIALMLLCVVDTLLCLLSWIALMLRSIAFILSSMPCCLRVVYR